MGRPAHPRRIGKAGHYRLGADRGADRPALTDEQKAAWQAKRAERKAKWEAMSPEERIALFS